RRERRNKHEFKMNTGIIEKKVRAWRAPWLSTIHLAIMTFDYPAGKCHAANFATGEEVPDGTMPPTFEMNMTMAQELMDNLWSCGVRPTEGSGSAGSLSATQRHLEDLRRL